MGEGVRYRLDFGQEPAHTTCYEQFVTGYVAAHNRSVDDTVDIDRIRAYVADCFVVAGPAGAARGQNDDSVIDTPRNGYELNKSIRTKRMAGILWTAAG